MEDIETSNSRKKPVSDTLENELETNINDGDEKHIDRNHVLDVIKRESIKKPIDISYLSVRSGVGYATLWSILREFEFCRLITLTEYVDDNNNRHVFISMSKGRKPKRYIPKEKAGEEENEKEQT